MSDKRITVEVKTTGPNYLGWRGELLAELALARVPSLVVHKRANGKPAEMPFDFLVCTEHGLCFFVIVRAFSSIRLGIESPETLGELRWAVDAELLRRVRASQSPVVLFLFDADTDHGRFLRLDTLPEPGSEAHRLAVRLPNENTLTKDSFEKLISTLQVTKRS